MIIRIAGLLVIVFSVTIAARDFARFFDVMADEDVGQWHSTIALVVSIVVPLVIGLLLICFPAAIVTRVLRVEGTDLGSEDTGPLQRVAISAIGLWFALSAIVDATYFYAKSDLYFRYVETSFPTRPRHLPADDFGGFVSCAVQFLIGFWLLLGNRGLVNMLGRIRGRHGEQEAGAGRQP